ncbi:hypothetical protein BDB01DRAFT_302190 [Pilobolus umbonatus]|nr:hypothetical protein BDB01DRAFT_302190 [Pilobolus umbonatus]
MEDYCVDWDEVYTSWKVHYSSYGPEAKHQFDDFYHTSHFFQQKGPGHNLPLALGFSHHTGEYQVVMSHTLYKHLLSRIQHHIPSAPSPHELAVTPQYYEIIDSVIVTHPNILTKLKRDAKRKNTARHKLLEAKQELQLAAHLVSHPSCVLLSLDIEAYESDHSICLELGWSMYDSRTDQFMDQHYMMSDYRHLTNGKFVSNEKLNFQYGVSVWCTLEEALIELRKDMDWACQRDGGFVLVGHGLRSDLKYLQEMKFQWPTVDGENTLNVDESAVLHVLNTDTMYGALIDNLHNPPSLGKTLDVFDIEHWGLHNAGNDAHYTLLLLMHLVQQYENRE